MRWVIVGLALLAFAAPAAADTDWPMPYFAPTPLGPEVEAQLYYVWEIPPSVAARCFVEGPKAYCLVFTKPRLCVRFISRVDHADDVIDGYRTGPCRVRDTAGRRYYRIGRRLFSRTL